jgi:hypothetical protein
VIKPNDRNCFDGLHLALGKKAGHPITQAARPGETSD